MFVRVVLEIFFWVVWDRVVDLWCCEWVGLVFVMKGDLVMCWLFVYEWIWVNYDVFDELVCECCDVYEWFMMVMLVVCNNFCSSCGIVIDRNWFFLEFICKCKNCCNLICSLRLGCIFIIVCFFFEYFCVYCFEIFLSFFEWRVMI